MQATPAPQTLSEDGAAPAVANDAEALAPSRGDTPLTYRSEGFAEDLDSSRPLPWRPPGARRPWLRWLLAALALAVGGLAIAVAMARHRLW